MDLRQAQRKQAKIKLAMDRVSGSGKSMSSLLLASGIVNEMKSVHPISQEVWMEYKLI